ncbi:hypothetical protein FJY63_09640 [Candidatus Sumerlaeota bacterium]|nr:hypothetical protein [Candidatus Sumerlaeota bacterium]
MSRKSKAEWEDTKREKEKETDDAVTETEDVKEEAGDAIATWNDQAEPVLLDTAEELDAIADSMSEDIEDQFAKEADETKMAVESEIQDTSNPARDAGENEGDAADFLDSKETGARDRFHEWRDSAVDVRKEAQEYFETLAEQSEQHQEEVTERISDLEQEIESARRGIHEFAM